MYTTRLYFEDECRRIGCGWRTVTIEIIGDWYYVTDCMGRRERIRTEVLDMLEGRAKTMRAA